MCLMLYIGSDRELPITKDWDKNEPSFCVIKDDDPLPAISNHLQTKYVYYIGSHEGCGCGFGYESSQEFEESMRADMPDEVIQMEIRDREDRITSVNYLREYLLKITLEGDVQLLVNWGNLEDKDIECFSDVSPDYFGGDEFHLKENSLFYVKSSR